MKIAIAGCLGRMGLTLLHAAQADSRFTLVAGSERAGFNNPQAQSQLASLGLGELTITDNPAQLAEMSDAVIDFTSPESTLAMAEALAARGNKIHVIGTTGFSAAQQAKLASCTDRLCVVQSGNFSLGINLLLKLVEQAAGLLDHSYDAEIFEMHHRHKKDAPSGTALMLGEAVARGRGVSLADKQVLERSGERKAGDIGFAVSRGGDVVGIHSVTLSGGQELIELKHQGFSRDIYARGALYAADWSKGKPAGLYSMKDILKG